MNNKKLLLLLPIGFILSSCSFISPSEASDNLSVASSVTSVDASVDSSHATSDAVLDYKYKNTVVNYNRNASGQIVYNKSTFSYKTVSEYYAPINGLKGNALKKGLYEIIRGQDKIAYNNSKWKEIYRIIDQDPNDENAINMAYTGVIHRETHFDREHIWPKSLGFTNYEDLEPGFDLHNLHPALGGLNSYRGNTEFDNSPDGIVNPYYGFRFKSGSLAFEPADHAKGDAARTIFYMAVRYEGKELVDGVARDLLDLELFNAVGKGLVDNIQYFGNVETLLEWNRLDPVDQAEVNRNELIYKDYQHNRNPFIDYPEFANYIFNDSYSNYSADISNPTSNRQNLPYPLNSGLGDILNGNKINEAILTGTTNGVGTGFGSNRTFTVQTFSFFASSCRKSGSFTLGISASDDHIEQKYYSAIPGMTSTSSASVLAMNYDNLNCNGVIFNVEDYSPSTYPNYLGNFKWYLLESVDSGTSYSLVKEGGLVDVELFQIGYLRSSSASVRYAFVISATGRARLDITRIATFSNASLK